MFSLSFIIILLIISTNSCDKNEEVVAGNDPNFTIIANDDSGLSSFNRKVQVFGIDIYAAKKVEDERLLHVANIMAQFLDNDEDGNVDNQLVLDAMIQNRAFVVMWKSERDLNINPPDDRIGQDLGNDETIINWHHNGQTGQFDASLEEIFHIISHSGYAYAYPSIFGEGAGTSLTDAMDVARGGHFTSVPSTYPASAWYSYDDTTCDYQCMTTEYIYWAMTSILGAQANRLDEIGHEWKLNTRTKVETTDALIYNLLTDSQYAFPTVLPDGTYRH